MTPYLEWVYCWLWPLLRGLVYEFFFCPSSKTNIFKFQFHPESEGPKIVCRRVLRGLPTFLEPKMFFFLNSIKKSVYQNCHLYIRRHISAIDQPRKVQFKTSNLFEKKFSWYLIHFIEAECNANFPSWENTILHVQQREELMWSQVFRAIRKLSDQWPKFVFWFLTWSVKLVFEHGQIKLR